MCLFFPLLLSSILFGIYFISVRIIHSKEIFSFVVVFLLNFLHTRALKISHVTPNGNEINLHPKNEVCIPHTSLLFNLWKPENKSAFLLITDVLLLAALSQCLWLCPGFSTYLGAQLIQLVLASLYLKHHFAVLCLATSFLPWCFTPIVQVWTRFPPKHQRTSLLQQHGPGTEWSQQPSALKEGDNIPWKSWQKTKRKGTGIYKVGMERQRRNGSFGINRVKRARQWREQQKSQLYPVWEKEGDTGLERVTNFRFQVSFIQLLCRF